MNLTRADIMASWPGRREEDGRVASLLITLALRYSWCMVMLTTMVTITMVMSHHTDDSGDDVSDVMAVVAEVRVMTILSVMAID